ncbi:MAG TPA: class I SAM-dependent methyltransferase [Chlamydiales bacterium]|nr:class I SAM-dependent methyltransferase [Chlamydiales bacterium]
MKTHYALLDSGDGQKLEQFGEYTLIRPCPQAVWRCTLKQEWEKASARFTREKEKNHWTFKQKLPSSWVILHGGVEFKISPTDFGHLGLFPEHADLWEWMRPLLSKSSRVLNLFAYSGGVTLAAAQQGAQVCHLDASKGMVDWARENAALNRLTDAPIRWIVDDAIKFLKREIKRESFYDGIVLDPPTYGRGSKGEIFKIEEEIIPLLELCSQLLTKKPLFVIFSCHTPGFTPLSLRHLLGQTLPKGHIEIGEMALHSPGTLPIPSGCFAKWTTKEI